MRPTPEDFRRHYASLSDDALLALDRGELVEEAQHCYDEELERRELSNASESEIEAMLPFADADRKIASSSIDSGSAPDWLDTAACACTFSIGIAGDGHTELETARSVLESAGIPCYVATHELSGTSPPVSEYELMVPGGYSILAQSLLDKEIFNPQMEATWKTHFELLSDEELATMSPHDLTGGLRDRIERLARVYNEEIKRRKM